MTKVVIFEHGIAVEAVWCSRYKTAEQFVQKWNTSENVPEWSEARIIEEAQSER